MKIFLLLTLFLAFASPAPSQTDSTTFSPIKAEIFNIPNLPVFIKKATFENLDQRADLRYSVTNLTASEIWNYEAVVYLFDSSGANVIGKYETCINLTFDEENKRCRYFPPMPLLKPRKTERSVVFLDEQVKPESKAVIALREVRGSWGIWHVDETKLQEAVQNYVRRKKYQPLAIQKLNHISFTNADKKAVIKSALEVALVEKSIPDYDLLKDKKNVVLSAVNLPPNFVPRLSGVNIIVLSPSQIQKKADLEGDFTFLSFAQIKANGDKLFVVLANTWAKSKTSKVMYLSGGGMFLEYRKENGRWIGESVGGWIS